MKKCLLAAAAVFCGSVVHAQGYAGAVSALSKIDFGCSASDAVCKNNGRGGKLYAGVGLSPQSVLNFGIGAVDAVEVAYIKFAQGKKSGTAGVITYDADNDVYYSRTAATMTYRQADAIAAAAVAHFQLFENATASAKLGVAYVSSTRRTSQEGVSMGGETAPKFKPYIGLGLEYNVPQVIRLVGSFDRTKYDVGGVKANATLIGLGAEKDF